MKVLRLVAVMFIWSVIHYGSLCSAEEENLPPHSSDLGKISVTAHRSNGGMAMHVDNTIPVTQIDKPSLSGSVLDSLKYQSGIQLTGNTFTGTNQTGMRLRGLDESRFRIYKDGVPISRNGSRTYSPAGWSRLLKDNVNRIEITRGAGPARFGNTLGGVINIISGSPREEPETVFSLACGSLGTMDTNVSQSIKTEKLSWDLSASHYNTDGYLRNNSFERNGLTSFFSLNLPFELELKTGIEYSSSETGMAVYNRPDSPFYNGSKPDGNEIEPMGPFLSPVLIDGVNAWGDDSNFEDESLSVSVQVIKEFNAGRASLSGRWLKEDAHACYYDSRDKNHLIYERDAVQEDGNLLLHGTVAVTVGNHSLETGGETSRYGIGDSDSTIHDESVFRNPGRLSENFVGHWKGQNDFIRYNALYIEDLWTPDSRIDLHFGLRGEWFDSEAFDFGDSGKAKLAPKISHNTVDPRFSITFRPWQSGSFRAGFNIAHRYPRMQEFIGRYWLDGEIPGNHDELGPEEAKQFEFSYNHSFGRFLNLTARAYHYDIDDYIASTFIPRKGRFVYNIKEVKLKGSELEMSMNLPGNLVFWSNVTWQKAEKKGDSWDEGNNVTTLLPDFPEKMVNLGLDYHFRKSLTASVTCLYTDSREHFNGTTLVELDSRTLLGMQLSGKIPGKRFGKYELIASAENILDKDYEEVEGYPMPGATFMGGIKATF